MTLDEFKDKMIAIGHQKDIASFMDQAKPECLNQALTEDWPANEVLGGCFLWEDSKEGSTHYEKICYKLEALEEREHNYNEQRNLH